jgi:hypothetical protein
MLISLDYVDVNMGVGGTGRLATINKRPVQQYVR